MALCLIEMRRNEFLRSLTIFLNGKIRECEFLRVLKQNGRRRTLNLRYNTIRDAILTCA